MSQLALSIETSTPAAPGRLFLVERITRAQVQANPTTLFCFGDNMERRGLGGQAAEMRGEPNVVGVPTKWEPRRDPNSYFRDADWQNATVREAIREAFCQIEEALRAGRDVVMPRDGFGTGLAELPRRAPAINSYIAWRVGELIARYSH